MTSSGCPDQRLLKDLLDDNLPGNDQKEVAAHLETCIDCQVTLEGLAAGDRSWSDMARHLGQRQPAAEAESALHQAVEQLAAGATRTVPPASAGADTFALDFLSPPSQPGALGRLGSYEILEVIGRGGMGVVLKARDDTLQRIVALKVLAPHLAQSETSRKRFVREAQAAAAVSHDHVVTIHAVDQSGPLPYLVMQYVAGISLEERLKRQVPMEAKEILRIGAQIASGLAAAHKQGLVHRDIKPGNILLENGSERVKITDFGLARAVDDVSLTQEGALAGTPMYMAPEQARAEPVDHRADLFSLGSVLYTLGTGRPPFRGDTTLAILLNVCEQTPAPIGDLNPDIPGRLEHIIDKLMAKKPADRYQSAQEVSDMLNTALAERPYAGRRSVQPIPTVRPAPKTASALRWVFGVIAALILVVLLSSAAVVAILFMQAQPGTTVMRKFTTEDKVLTKDIVTQEKDGWKITVKNPQSVKLFEVANPGVDDCTVFYRAKIKTENIQGKAYLEMWLRFPGKGEFFSKGLHMTVTGTTDWSSYEIPFFLKKGEQPDLIKVNVMVDGTGTLHMKEIELVKGPLPKQ